MRSEDLKISEHVIMPLTRFALKTDKDYCRDDDVCLGSGDEGNGKNICAISDDSHVRDHKMVGDLRA